MTDPVWKQIDEYEFKVSPLPGMRNLKVFTKMAGMLAKGASNGVAALQAAKTEGEQSMLFLALLSNVEPADVEYLARELLATAVVKMPDGKQSGVMPIFDTLFQAKLDVLFKLLVEAMKVNYGNFFKGLSEKAASAQAEKIVSGSSSLPTSPTAGPAGD